jgi:uncharacterized protein
MTNEERDIISRFIERVGGAQGTSFGSVPGAVPPLPPIDREADALIGELFAKYPEARYRLTQTAFVQEHALAEAQNRIKRLEYEVQQAQAAMQEAAAQQPRSGGFLSGLFGGGPPRPPASTAPPPVWNQGGPQQGYAQPQYGQGYAPGGPPPPPQYAPGYQPGMFQRSGSGFLGSALTTAAGVAGGVVVGNALMDMFSSHRSAASELGAGSGFTPAAPVDSSPWGAPAGGDQGYVDQGSWTTPDAGTDQGGGYADQGSWDAGGGDQASWDSSGGDDGGSDDNNA